jgi:hypothetical protein
MKTFTTLVIFFLLFLVFPVKSGAQQEPRQVSPSDTINPEKGHPKKQLKEIKEEKEQQLVDSTGNEPVKSPLVDTTVQNKYGDLLDDDTAYNRKYPIWIPLFESAGANAVIWSIDKYMLNADFAQVGPETWKANLKHRGEWDVDKFGVNFIGHPYSGSLYYNAGRSNGYNYFQSGMVAVAGSLMWEYFGENTPPSYNDVIVTPVNGAFFGEIFYRLSSNILDDRTTGIQRVSRELLAGLINPMRGLNRILQGKTFRRTNKEVYQKEPLNVTLYSGMHLINQGLIPDFADNTTSIMFNAQFDYGNPFEHRRRKPYDFFKFRVELDFGAGEKILSNATGYGILSGKNVRYGEHSLLFGTFQYYDYWDNMTFELGAIGFGGGVFSKIPIGKESDIYTNIHAAVIPFAGNSTHFGPDTVSEFRTYNFGGGLEGKFESTVNIGKRATASMIFYYFYIHTYEGIPGDNFIGILKPRITVNLFKGLSVGAEYYVYYNDRYIEDFEPIHSKRSEQKLFLLYYFEDNQRRGKYN